VVIGDFRRPWNARPEARKLAAGIPKATLWAREPGGIEQVGCVYTAQGFEFDYAGVIWGPDLAYDLQAGAWRGDRQKSHDKTVARAGEGFLDLVKNTYRVLLSRGLKGCYVYFMDKETEQFVRSRMDLGETGAARVPVALGHVQPAGGPVDQALPFRVMPADEVRPYENCVPVLDLAVAAGRFSETQDVTVASGLELARDPGACRWAELPEEIRPRDGMFVARVVGESMNRRIPNGAWCLFRAPAAGSRQGRVVVAQHHSIADPETGGSYTVKVYESQKEQQRDGTWRHAAVILRPDSSMAGFEALTFTADDAESLRIVAELVAVLG